MISSPYYLKSRNENPIQFYDDLAQFTDHVIEKGSHTLQSYIDEFISFSEKQELKIYQANEHLMELLMAGVFWTNYHYQFSNDSIFYEPMFNKLFEWRKKYPRFKKRIDSLRGKLVFRYLTVQRNMDIPIHQRFKFMNSWLNCSKEFTQEYERLSVWKLFLEQQPVMYQQEFWNKTLAFAGWFIQEGEKQLSEYTQNWEDFMMDTYTYYEKKEDFIFCTRKPSEYHLNMVAAEVMNRSLKPGFSKTKNKIVLLPTCMTRSLNCQAEQQGKNLVCKHCTANCQVSKITHRLNKEGINTVLIPHSSGFSEFLKPWQNSKDTSLIGVACVLNLITGGYEMQKLNIPSQCVFLDACGCKKHWLSGEPTELNEHQLYNLLIHEAIERPVNSAC
ncbi:MAG TPA: hypothetical protein DCQ26_00465 [Marinilabiliales bacterium]|jgi:hypothetical protein|nr:MAG: hypothetical protein A2W95_08305 [Bacteroidetes bacterium GWA2_40_14]OFX63762.1 MAG: hypothetical protein A2W84_17000 [Bacteroidetes bacterium GWC2_40_13]OFX75202.1 MAG: hypothetical protein A2W96_16515 [Bacteroidetes bacterium GWD2_40_43]OFX89799.1 MAG: hypothetical protein A2W97_12175 [Bacteroidetes bacterium GWE2_40_63]OFY22008.1 MAG: hypothetical protein A2W88_00670 [Bacteroidetes bacterium GWF2_40_13]OFZ26097.1 MAG: hypothetical protein A2437_10500 [Bacteroidetes bacterium RIFOXYC